MAKMIVNIIFPQEQIKKPVIYTMAKKFDVMPNVRRAKVTETVGEMTLVLSGTKDNLEKGRRYLEKQGLKVEPVVADIVE